MLVALFLIFLAISLLDPDLVLGGAYYIGVILFYVALVGVFCVGLFYLAVIYFG